MIQEIRRRLWNILALAYPFYLKKVYGMDIANNAIISHKSKLDRSVNPKGIHIGSYTWITSNAVILSHDHVRGMKVDTYIGDRCFIGMNSIVMPGVKIGNEVVVASGSVVTKDVPSNCIVAGNPAQILKRDIHMTEKGQLKK